MRIAHRHHAAVHGLLIHIEAVSGTALTLRVEVRCGRSEIGDAHVYGNAAAPWHLCIDQSTGAFHAYAARVATALKSQQLGDAARTVAALLHLVTVGIEDAIEGFGVDAARALDDQCLIKADAAMAIGQLLPLLRRELFGNGIGLEHDKVVAQPVHLGEIDLHRAHRIHRGPR